MDENVCSVWAADEAKALLVVEELHCTYWHNLTFCIPAVVALYLQCLIRNPTHAAWVRETRSVNHRALRQALTRQRSSTKGLFLVTLGTVCPALQTRQPRQCLRTL